MAPLEKLSELGFANAAIVGERRGTVMVRVRTTLGWVYEKFPATDADAAVTAWALGRSPE